MDRDYDIRHNFHDYSATLTPSSRPKPRALTKVKRIKHSKRSVAKKMKDPTSYLEARLNMRARTKVGAWAISEFGEVVGCRVVDFLHSKDRKMLETLTSSEIDKLSYKIRELMYRRG